MPTDRFALHRSALEPLLEADTSAREGILKRLRANLDPEGFASFLLEQGLAPSWYALLNHSEVRFGETFITGLRTEALSATANYLLQRQAIDSLRKALDGAGIAHVIFKGVHVRELVHSTPALRGAGDIDLLVTAADRFAALRAFRALGYELIADASTVSHEASLVNGNVCVDLHWDILRPGRTRVPLAGEIIGNCIDFGSHWGPDDNIALFLMQVHPVITKYCNAPYAGIVRVLDMVLWLEKRDVDWKAQHELLDRSGMKTAAWIMWEWVRLVTGIVPPEEFLRLIAPGALRQAYLRNWLAGNYSGRLQRWRLLIQLGFTLPAHDRPGDVARATMTALRARRTARQDLAGLENQALKD